MYVKPNLFNPKKTGGSIKVHDLHKDLVFHKAISIVKKREDSRY